MTDEQRDRKKKVERIGTAVLAGMVSHPTTSPAELDMLPGLALRLAEMFVDKIEESYPEEDEDDE